MNTQKQSQTKNLACEPFIPNPVCSGEVYSANCFDIKRIYQLKGLSERFLIRESFHLRIANFRKLIRQSCENGAKWTREPNGLCRVIQFKRCCAISPPFTAAFKLLPLNLKLHSLMTLRLYASVSLAAFIDDVAIILPLCGVELSRWFTIDGVFSPFFVAETKTEHNEPANDDCGDDNWAS